MLDSTPANTNDRDEVAPWFVAKVAVLALAIHLAFGQWTYGPHAVIVFFGCLRLASSVPIDRGTGAAPVDDHAVRAEPDYGPRGESRKSAADGKGRLSVASWAR